MLCLAACTFQEVIMDQACASTTRARLRSPSLQHSTFKWSLSRLFCAVLCAAVAVTILCVSCCVGQAGRGSKSSSKKSKKKGSSSSKKKQPAKATSPISAAPAAAPTPLRKQSQQSGGSAGQKGKHHCINGAGVNLVR
jgi:hypothetical protein